MNENCDSCGNAMNEVTGIFQIENEGTICGACYDDYCIFCFEDGEEYDPEQNYALINE